MSDDDSIGIIDLGNINIKCLIFKTNNNNIEVQSTSITPSDGFHNDVVVNLSKASSSIRSCINEAEKKAKVSLKKINVIFEQPDFLCTKFSKHKKIDGSKIHKDDIEFLLKEAKKQLTLNDKKHSIIHIFNHNYIVDGKQFVEEPIDVYADTLTHEITFITVPKNNLKNINQVFINCDIEIEKLISRNFTLGAYLLNHEELQVGSAILDIGFEKISFGLFKNLALVHSITFPIGINHIVKDIAKVCSLNTEESENVKNDFSFSFEENQKIFDDKDYLKKNYFINSNFRKISKSLITNVIKARLEEVCDLIRKQLKISGFNLTNSINILLTGGGSNLNNVEKYFINFFGPKVKKLDKNNFKNDLSIENDFISSLGAIKIIKDGWETEAIPKTGGKDIEKKGFFAKIFKIY